MAFLNSERTFYKNKTEILRPWICMLVYIMEIHFRSVTCNQCYAFIFVSACWWTICNGVVYGVLHFLFSSASGWKKAIDENFLQYLFFNTIQSSSSSMVLKLQTNLYNIRYAELILASCARHDKVRDDRTREKDIARCWSPPVLRRP